MAEKRPTFNSIVEKATEAVQGLELSYSPTDQERRLRALFYVALEDHPVADADNITPALIEQLTNDSRILKWWSKPGFKEWFQCRVTLQAKAEYALDLLIDSFIDLARSDDPKTVSAKVAAAKLLAEMRGHTGKAKKQQALDVSIPETKEELEAYVKKLQAVSNK
jgi:hypothetical protein